MKKKKHLPPVHATAAPRNTPFFTPLSKKLLLSGVLVAVLGFGVLTFTDPAGQNWASILSPFLLVSGYAMIGISLTLQKPK